MDKNVNIITRCGTWKYKQAAGLYVCRCSTLQAHIHAACYWNTFQVLVKNKSSGTLDTGELVFQTFGCLLALGVGGFSQEL